MNVKKQIRKEVDGATPNMADEIKRQAFKTEPSKKKKGFFGMRFSVIASCCVMLLVMAFALPIVFRGGNDVQATESVVTLQSGDVLVQFTTENDKITGVEGLTEDGTLVTIDKEQNYVGKKAEEVIMDVINELISHEFLTENGEVNLFATGEKEEVAKELVAKLESIINEFKAEKQINFECTKKLPNGETEMKKENMKDELIQIIIEKGEYTDEEALQQMSKKELIALAYGCDETDKESIKNYKEELKDKFDNCKKEYEQEKPEHDRDEEEFRKEFIKGEKVELDNKKPPRGEEMGENGFQGGHGEHGEGQNPENAPTIPEGEKPEVNGRFEHGHKGERPSHPCEEVEPDEEVETPEDNVEVELPSEDVQPEVGGEVVPEIPEIENEVVLPCEELVA